MVSNDDSLGKDT